VTKRREVRGVSLGEENLAATKKERVKKTKDRVANCPY
jgi:hypothetical protein